MGLVGEERVRRATTERHDCGMEFPGFTRANWAACRAAQGNAMNCTKQDKREPDNERAPVCSEQEQLRRQLLEMIRRNEERRRLKAK